LRVKGKSGKSGFMRKGHGRHSRQFIPVFFSQSVSKASLKNPLSFWRRRLQPVAKSYVRMSSRKGTISAAFF
jgi:hypothetical protein